ncbi:ABC transporter permease [Siphonobacter sp. SORGH_AS_1065]|uniref:ABC transporter permease n=1 Tax=Siphonobacter sp. SORGH_AS_1065 TaxID=3041795 RepID=UPI00278A711D|nr:ABC transporter permease [Siphonobacter sp. SORGH_AS_1065]MDQ1085835.1 putative ABC transport system permease protein [Siphonobacter sp. SORGH_AS_1065]
MIRNYIKIAFRNFWRNRLTSSINVLGLSIGISACIVIFLLVDLEFSYDRHHLDHERMYRLVTDLKFGGEEGHSSGLPAPVPEIIKKAIPGIEVVSAFHKVIPAMTTVKHGKQATINFKNPFDSGEFSVVVDENFFKIMPAQWLIGSPETALTKPNQIVLTESEAKRLYGLASPWVIGQELQMVIYSDTLQLQVSGLIKDPVVHSDFQFPSYISLATYRNVAPSRDVLGLTLWSGVNSSSQCLVKVQPEANLDRITKNMNTFVAAHTPKNAVSFDIFYRLQSLSDVHFNQNYPSGHRIAHRPTLVGLSMVGVALLLLACINFVNLNTAHASQRAKEIGIRKTLGSRRRNLIFQSLGETLLVTLIGVGLSVFGAEVGLIYLSDLLPEGLQLPLGELKFWLFLIGITLLTSLLAGFYPGLVISGFSPVIALKNQWALASSQRMGLRRGLIVGQFTIAQAFIIAALFMGRQLHFMIYSDLGFSKDAIIRVNLPDEAFRYKQEKGQRYTLADRIRKLAGVEGVSLSNESPLQDGKSFMFLDFVTGKEKKSLTVGLKPGDIHYISVYGFKFLAGRNFVKSDTINEFVINKTMSRNLGFKHPQEAIGKFVTLDNKPIPIVGVIQDFHFETLHKEIGSVALMNDKSAQRDFHIKLSNLQTAAATLAQIKQLWLETYPAYSFDYKFFDESIAKLYEKEQNLSKLVNLFTGIAILISCLGLFGLITFSAERRTKEIGIRKVLGASVLQIVTLLSKEFLLLLGLAFVLSVPAAWYFLHEWLTSFAYRTELSWWIFAGAGVMAVCIALLTVSSQAIRAANADPVKSLKSE